MDRKRTAVEKNGPGSGELIGRNIGAVLGAAIIVLTLVLGLSVAIFVAFGAMVAGFTKANRRRGRSW
jgi:hypothetical protein